MLNSPKLFTSLASIRLEPHRFEQGIFQDWRDENKVLNTPLPFHLTSVFIFLYTSTGRALCLEHLWLNFAWGNGFASAAGN